MANPSQALSLLNEQDVAALRQLIEREKRRPQNQPGPSDSLGEDNQRSGIFAYLPSGETIAARTVVSDTEFVMYGTELHLFTEMFDSPSQRTLKDAADWEEYVFNPSNSIIEGPRLLYTHLTVQGTRVVVVEPCNVEAV